MQKIGAEEVLNKPFGRLKASGNRWFSFVLSSSRHEWSHLLSDSLAQASESPPFYFSGTLP